MRIHTNSYNSMQRVFAAARFARATIDFIEQHKSQTHEHAFEVILSGESRHRQSSRERNFAATWDQWGVFLAVLFAQDENMRVGGIKNHIYANAADFHRKTDGRFDNDGWPEDAHGDHVFRWDSLSTKCTKCSARVIR